MFVDTHDAIAVGGFTSLFLLILVAIISTILYSLGMGPLPWLKYLVVVLISIFTTLVVLSEVLKD